MTSKVRLPDTTQDADIGGSVQPEGRWCLFSSSTQKVVWKVVVDDCESINAENVHLTNIHTDIKKATLLVMRPVATHATGVRDMPATRDCSV